MYYQSICLLAAATLLFSCATLEPTPMTQRDCETLDVYQYGVQHGVSGEPFYFKPIETQCADQGVALSVAEYSRGWQAGLRLRGFHEY